MRKKTTKPPEPPAVSLQRVVRAQWDIDPKTGEAREWRLVARENIEGQNWTFQRGTKLRGFKDYKFGKWCVYSPGDYESSRIFGVPPRLIKIEQKTKRPNEYSATPVV
jgi:hypothetical protein